MAKTLGSLSVGDTVQIATKGEGVGFFGDHVIFKVAAKNHTGYPQLTTHK